MVTRQNLRSRRKSSHSNIHILEFLVFFLWILTRSLRFGCALISMPNHRLIGCLDMYDSGGFDVYVKLKDKEQFFLIKSNFDIKSIEKAIPLTSQLILWCQIVMRSSESVEPLGHR